MYAYRPKESSRTDEIWSRRSSHRRIASGLTHYQSVCVCVGSYIRLRHSRLNTVMITCRRCKKFSHSNPLYFCYIRGTTLCNKCASTVVFYDKYLPR